MFLICVTGDLVPALLPLYLVAIKCSVNMCYTNVLLTTSWMVNLKHVNIHICCKSKYEIQGCSKAKKIGELKYLQVGKLIVADLNMWLALAYFLIGYNGKPELILLSSWIVFFQRKFLFIHTFIHFSTIYKTMKQHDGGGAM